MTQRNFTHIGIYTNMLVDCCILEEDPIDWWDAYVPLESWIPPKLESILTFQGIIRLESYPVYKCKFTITPIQPEYELCFNGDFDEVTSMLSNIYVIKLLRTPNFLRGQHSQTIEGSDELGGATSEGHATSKGWHNLAARNMLTYVDEIEHMPNSQTSPHPMDPVPDSTTLIDDPYDCRWDGAIPLSNQLSMPDPYYCGLEDQTAALNEVIMPGEVYDLYESKWANPMVNRAVSPNESATSGPYDCGWEDTVDTKASPMNVSSEERLNPSQDEGINQPSYQEGHDSMNHTAPLSHSIDKVIQLRHVGNRSYKCGWDDLVVHETALSKLLMANPYDCRWEDDAVLPEKTTRPGDSTNETYGLDDIDMENTLPDIEKDSTEDLYDCGWDNLMDNITIKEQPEVSEMREENDDIDLTSPEGREVIDLTSSPATSRQSFSLANPNVFEEAKDIGHNDFNQYINSIVTPVVTCVPDPQLALIFMVNRSLFGAYMDAKDQIMDLLDAMITGIEQRQPHMD
ncbi:hypothetical protein BDR06DRAFT_971894 [Suillus hirtellus]|nr:hypothetical protein BDR06DRAFT_971894 [Suillus hirtellus]